MKRLFRLRKDSFILAVVAFFGVVILGILPGLLVTIGISVLLVLGRFARPEATVLGRIPPSDVYVPVITSPLVRPEPGLMVIRPSAPIVFVNSAWLREAIAGRIADEAYPPWVVVLDLGASADLDVAGLDLLRAIARDGQQARRMLWLSHVNPRVQEVIDRGGLAAEYPTVRIFLTNELATRAFLDTVHRDPAPGGTQRPERGIT
ncbi:MAG: STAS domain-containing protein [Thermomicrobiales bacterium]